MKHVLIALIRLYKKLISPLLPSACRFNPTCSAYAVEALGRYGALRGGVMALWRILRCNPFCRAGSDPVPPVFRLPPWGGG